MDNKIYSPQVITDQPYPVGTDTTVPTGSDGTKQVMNPSQITDTGYPARPIARELLSEALNTKSKKILQEFTLAQQGGIQVGAYTPGVSGDIRITPVGIVARNLAGETTVGIDGDTGDAIFLGTLKAKTIMADDENIVIEEAGSGNGRIVLYNDGIAAIVIGDPT